MLWLARWAWRYRTEITLAVQFLAALRKSARETTQEYIRRRLHQKLKRQLAIVGLEIGLLSGAYFLHRGAPGLWTARVASATLWGITLYNLYELIAHTLPELRAVHRQLRGKVGYALKYFLQISLATELMQLNVVFLAVCLILGISTRTYVGSHFAYLKPWQGIAQRQGAKPLKHH